MARSNPNGSRSASTSGWPLGFRRTAPTSKASIQAAHQRTDRIGNCMRDAAVVFCAVTDRRRRVRSRPYACVDDEHSSDKVAAQRQPVPVPDIASDLRSVSRPRTIRVSNLIGDTAHRLNQSNGVLKGSEVMSGVFGKDVEVRAVVPTPERPRLGRHPEAHRLPEFVDGLLGQPRLEACAIGASIARHREASSSSRSAVTASDIRRTSAPRHVTEPRRRDAGERDVGNTERRRG